MIEPWLASPVFLLALAVIPIAAAFMLYAWRRRQYGRAQLGSSGQRGKGLLVGWRMRRWKTVALFAALFLMVVACARPQWGLESNPPRRAGRDVILVVDLSRSMLAEQPSRIERALRALRQLADAFENDGGNRVALILFAGRAELLFPFTQDFDHLRHALNQIETHDYPSLKRDDSVSGTRIGAALTLAVETCEPGRSNHPVIVLLSDGDDPAADDNEWLAGVALATAKRVRVHTVGFGDPVQGHTIPVGKERLEYDGKPVRTRLNEDRLRAIAGPTGGVYLPARTEHSFPLGAYVRYLLDAEAWRPHEPDASAFPAYRQRYAWFLLPAVVLFMLTMLLNEGPVSRGVSVRDPLKRTSKGMPTRAPVVVMVLIALALISAASAPPLAELLRQGDEAFALEKYDAALQLYEQAESRTFDPGLVAFNKAAAYYRLGRFREAIESYRCCLDDDRAAPARRARAHFYLGNALLQNAGDDAALLAQSAAAYRACLQQPDLDTKLRDDARHNLEVAQQLWLKAIALQKGPPKKNGDQPPPERPDGKAEWQPIDPKKDQKIETDPDAPPKKSDWLYSNPTPQVLHDNDKVQAISPADTEATLKREADRIAGRRRTHRHPDGPAAVVTKDW